MKACDSLDKIQLKSYFPSALASRCCLLDVFRRNDCLLDIPAVLIYSYGTDKLRLNELFNVSSVNLPTKTLGKYASMFHAVLKKLSPLQI